MFRLGLDPAHFTMHLLHNVQPLIDFSYVILVVDEKTVAAFIYIQNKIRDILSSEQYFTLHNEFHITLYTHVYADANYQNCVITPETLKERYAYYCAWAKQQASQVFQTQPAWGILYTSIIITPDSIIAVAEDSGAMQQLRYNLVRYGNQHEIYDQCDEKTIYPNIIHTTLVRFLNPASLEERLAIYEKLKTQLPLLLPLQIKEIEFRQFERYGLFPKGPAIFTTNLGLEVV